MIKTLHTSKSGFTLVEIMIVVAIIALLATIAVPSFLRARKRSQATKIVNDARILESSIDQWAIEKNKTNSDAVTWSDVSDYVKESSELFRTSGADLFGNAFTMATVADGVKVNQTSYDNLSDVTTDDFWGSYKP